MYTAICDIANAGELLRAACDGRIMRGDGSYAGCIEATSFAEGQRIIDGVSGPFATAREAEDKAFAALRAWQDRSRAQYWAR